MFKKVILAALVVTSAVFAQFNVNVGGRAAANFGTFVGDLKDPGWGLGFNAGVAAKLDVLPIMSVVAGVEADLRRVSNEKTEEYRGVKASGEAAYTMWYLDIPVVARFNVVPMFHFDAGFVLGFNLAANYRAEASVEGIKIVDIDESISENVNTFDAALTAGFGASVIPGMLDIDFRFVYSLTSFAKNDKAEGDDDESARHMRMQLGATFWFM